MRLPSLLLVLSAVLALPAAAGADQVVSKVSRWDDARTSINTEVTVRRASGALERFVVPGGVVDGIGMVRFHLEVPGGLPPDLMQDFVRTRTSQGTRLRWQNSCVYITPDARGTSDLDGDEEQTILREVLEHWTAETDSCAYLSFMLDEPVDSREVGYDGYNLVKFRETEWCRPATKTKAKECYSSQAAAITTLFFIDDPSDSDDGAILDADIELNAVHFAVSVGNDSNGTGSAADLANTLTHEVGHLIGLDHTCWDMNGSPGEDDSTGAEIPRCEPTAALSQRVRDATMYNFQDPGETKKRSVEDDDVDGFCGIYPTGDDPGMCKRAIEDDEGCGCRVGARSRPVAGTLTVMGLFLGLAFAISSIRRR